MTEGRRHLRALVLVLLGAAVAIAYALAASAAPTDHEARLAQRAAERAALPGSFKAGFRRGFRRGVADGDQRGSARARAVGLRRGSVAGGQAVIQTVSAIQRALDAEAAANATKLAGSKGVLVIGDSLEVLTSPYLRRYLPSQPLTINAEGGYSSIQLFGLFRASYESSQSVIVFDAGTNDNPAYPQILAARLAAVAKLIGNRCMVVPTIHGLTVNGIGSRGKNRTVKAFAASRPGTATPDWAGAVAQDPGLLQPDHLHPTPEGADYRARLIAEGVQECLAQDLGLEDLSP